jgi:glutamyl-tRNA synthetase
MDDATWSQTIADWADRQLGPSIPRPIDAGLVAAVAPLLRERVQFLVDIAPTIEFLFGYEAPEYDRALLLERLDGDRDLALRILDAALVALDGVAAEAWSVEAIEAAIRGLETPLSMKLRRFVSVLYVAEMGRPQGIPLFDSLAILGRERALQRLRTARSRVEHR